jgi:hypothetical protein
MKVKLLRIFVVLSVVSLFIVGVYAANSPSSCTLNKGESSKETNAVGVSKSADWMAKGYSDSTYRSYVDIYAAWTGWPYTKEYAGSVFANGILEYRETQSKDSVFYLKLRPMNPSKQSHSYGTIKAI